MFKTKFQQVFAALVIVAMIVGSAGAAVSAAPLAQDVAATTVEGTIGAAVGGDYPKIWLGLKTEPNNQTTTVTIEWDRFDTNGIGFYLLDAAGLNSVLNGSQDVREANLAVSTPLPDTPSNIAGASFKATGSDYTIVVFNDTPQDASFTLSVTNGVITNDDGSVTDADAAMEEDDADATAPAADDAATDEATTTEATTPAATETVTTTTTVTPEATTPETTAPAATVTTEPAVLEATEVEGELPNQDDQHYLGLRPDERDANITLDLTFEPQDDTNLARRLNFWVLDNSGFVRYQQTGDRLSTLAIAAGSTNVDTAANERVANFTASGEGDYTVIVYNSSNVPATYKLVSTNGVLIDDSGQTLTAQEQVTATTTTTTTTTTDAATTTTAGATTTDTTTPAKPASAPAASSAGGTYTVQSGDTLATIARDVYGDFQLYEQLCAFNGIANCDLIEVGDVIKLPTADEIGAESMTVPAASTEPAATTTPAETTVKPSATVTETTTVTGTESITGTSAITGTEVMTGTDASAADADIIDTLIADGNYKNLVAALEAAGLVESLRASGPFSLFAPTDAAFAAFDTAAPGVVQELLVDPTNQLAQILLYHVVSGEHTSSDITNGQVLTTLQGGQLTMSVAGNTIGVNSATVSSPDNAATNGVIHGIDNVLLVPTE